MEKSMYVLENGSKKAEIIQESDDKWNYLKTDGSTILENKLIKTNEISLYLEELGSFGYCLIVSPKINNNSSEFAQAVQAVAAKIDSEVVCKEDEIGTRRYYNSDSVLHREDGPAVEFTDGSVGYFYKGLCHREDGPAVILKDGSKLWYLNGRLHRTDDGPTIEMAGGIKAWHKEGLIHRENAPAIVRPGGLVEFWENGKCISVSYENTEEDY